MLCLVCVYLWWVFVIWLSSPTDKLINYVVIQKMLYRVNISELLEVMICLEGSCHLGPAHTCHYIMGGLL